MKVFDHKRYAAGYYIVNVQRFQEDRYFYQEGSFAYIMSQERSIDIDTEIDFKMEELIMMYKEDDGKP